MHWTAHACRARLADQPADALAQFDAAGTHPARVEIGLLAMHCTDAGFEPGALRRGQVERVQVRRDALLAAGGLEQLGIALAAPVPGDIFGDEGIVERLPVRLLGVGERSIDIEQKGANAHACALA